MVWCIMTNKTWGGRFKKPTDPRVAEFNSSIHFDEILYQFDITGSVAHAKMLCKQGLITKDENRLISKGLEDIAKEMEAETLAADPECEDVHMFIEQELVRRIGDVGKKLHTGRSRNDQVALDLRMYARAASASLIEGLMSLDETLVRLAKKHKDDVMPGYTHLQQAQPVKLGVYFDAYSSMFKRDMSRLFEWYERSNYSPLGAGALAGSGLPLDREFVAEELEFSGVIENTLDAVSDRDFVIELCSVGSMIMVHLSRLCEDIIIWSTQEFNYITLDDAFATGSSLMPNKKNPDIAELVRGKSGRVFGNLMGILTVMKGLPLAYNKDMQEDKECLFDTMDTVIDCVEIMDPFLSSMKFNTDIMKARANSGYLDATALLESFVLKGMAFRDAHHKVGELVAEAMEKGISLKELMKDA